jgi:CheY-like chemotaxis protein
MSSNTEFRRLHDLQTAPRCILFVEDSPPDYEIACIQLKKVHLRNKTHCVSTSDEMLEYLRAMDLFLDRERFPMPAVIIMDQRLPGGASGLEAQQMLRADLRFRRIPIIAISSSEQIPILRAAMELGADAWMTKPFNGAEFRHIAQDLDLPVEFEEVNVEATTVMS